MTKRELLTTYRSKVIELEELRYQLKRVGTDGRPVGCRTGNAWEAHRSTNNRDSAAIQLAEGLEAMARKKEDDLNVLAKPMEHLLSEIPDCRTYLVIQRYYAYAETDEQVARSMSISRVRANQIRHSYLNSL